MNNNDDRIRKIREKSILMSLGKIQYDESFIKDNVSFMSNNTITTLIVNILKTSPVDINYSMLHIIINNLKRDIYKKEWENVLVRDDFIIAFSIFRSKQEPQIGEGKGVYFYSNSIEKAKYNHWICMQNIKNELAMKIFINFYGVDSQLIVDLLWYYNRQNNIPQYK
jgi:hypothetical protein